MIKVSFYFLSFVSFLICPFSFGRDVSQSTARKIEVVVEKGKFVPDVIATASGMKTEILFKVEDSELCRKTIAIRGLGLVTKVTVGKNSLIELNDVKPGKYHIECETGVFCGILFVTGSEKDRDEHYFAPHPE